MNDYNTDANVTVFILQSGEPAFDIFYEVNFNPVAFRTGPVHWLVFAIHAGFWLNCLG